MARSELTDPLMTHNFALIEVPVAISPPFVSAFFFKLARSALINRNFVSFQTISMPTVEVQTKEISEGNWHMVHHVPLGYSTAGQVTLAHAVVPEGLDMYLWIRQSILGKGAPRRHMIVAHMGIDKLIPRRLTVLKNCIPISWQPSTDLDAMTPSVALETLVLQVEDVEYNFL